MSKIYRNKRTGKIYEDVSFNGTQVAEVRTINSTYLVDVDSLEEVTDMEQTKSTPTGIGHDQLDEYITGLIQHADKIEHSSEVDLPIIEWKSYPRMKQALQHLITTEIIAELERLLDEINVFQEPAPEPNETLKRVNKAIFKRCDQLKAKETQL